MSTLIAAFWITVAIFAVKGAFAKFREEMANDAKVYLMVACIGVIVFVIIVHRLQ